MQDKNRLGVREQGNTREKLNRNQKVQEHANQKGEAIRGTWGTSMQRQRNRTEDWAGQTHMPKQSMSYWCWTYIVIMPWIFYTPASLVQMHIVHCVYLRKCKWTCPLISLPAIFAWFNSFGQKSIQMEEKLKENFHRVQWLTEWFNGYDNNVNHMLCPSQSPDPNPNEHLERRIRQNSPPLH